MANPNVQEAGTYSSAPVVDDFFKKWPTDNRYLNVYEQQFEPKSSLQVGKNIGTTFNFKFGGGKTDLS